jgi:hypothetical protein
LHRLVDSLPEEDLTTAGRLLIGLTATADAVERALFLAPPDDELDTDDEDGGLTEARRELARGEGPPLRIWSGSLVSGEPRGPLATACSTT